MRQSTGSPDTRLIVLRGPSGAGKSSTARGLRGRVGRSLAIVEQDYLRRIVLKERDVRGAANVSLISQTARFALDHGWHAVVEGILFADHYRSMLEGLVRDHAGPTFLYYFDVELEETLRRHLTRPQASEFTFDDMRSWYVERDLLESVPERVVPQQSSLVETVNLIYRDAFETGSSASTGAHAEGLSNRRSNL